MRRLAPLLLSLSLLLLLSLPSGAQGPGLPRWDAPAVVPAPLPRYVRAPLVPAGIVVRYVVNPLVVMPTELVAPPAKPVPARRNRALQARNGAAAVAWLKAQQGLRMWANNRSPQLDQWAREAGVPLGSEWCGLTQMQAQKAVGLPWPAGPAGSYNWVQPGPRQVYQAGRIGRLDSIRVGHKTGLYNVRKGRVAHVMAVALVVKADEPGRPPRGFYTWAGNEGSGAKEGVHLTYYPATNIHAASNWNYK